MTSFFKKMKSPVGQLTLVANDKSLIAVLWEDDDPNRVRFPKTIPGESHPVLVEADKQLNEYFNGERRDFSLPLKFRGTAFQEIVWQELTRIPFGKCSSYSELAKKIGKPSASRAVGGANGKNPLSIVVPCHRVIGSNGKLTGFAGGLKTKEFLLKHELKIIEPNLNRAKSIR